MLQSHYDRTLVALSIIIAMVAAYAAFSVADRVLSTQGHFRRVWITAGAVVMGFAIWSMHYVGMLAFQLPTVISYDVPMVIGSMLAAIAASAVALGVTARPSLGKSELLAGSVFMGAGISAMHYIGMAAMRGNCVCIYSPPIVALSVAISVLVSGFALGSLRLPSKVATFPRLCGAMLLGIAISSMHYTGMAAARFFPTSEPVSVHWGWNVTRLGAIGIAGCAFLVLSFSLFGAMADRYLSAQALKLESTEHRYRLLFERSFAGRCRCDSAGTILDCNPAFLQLLGLENAADVAGLSLTNEILTGEASLNYMSLLARMGTIPAFETQLRHSDGSLIWVLASGTLFSFPGEPLEVQALFLSIEEQKGKEAELENAKRLADSANDAKTQFLSNMSHELRTPLVGVLGMADILEDCQSRAEQQECLGVIRDSAKSLLALIGQILDYAAKSQPGQRAGDSAFSIVEMVSEELQNARMLAHGKDIRLHMISKIDSGAIHWADPNKVRSILRALLENAVKFTVRGEVLVTISSRGRSPRAEFIRIAVRDTGIGIPPELHETIFEAFQQADNSNSRRFGGAGIGLSVAREAARSLGGDILVESEPGSGSTFLVDVAFRRQTVSIESTNAPAAVSSAVEQDQLV